MEYIIHNIAPIFRISFSYFIWLIILLFIVPIVFKIILNFKLSKLYFSNTLILLITFAYSFMLILYYVYIFDPYESENIASFHRYLYPILSGLFFFNFNLFFIKYFEIVEKSLEFKYLFIFMFFLIDVSYFELFNNQRTLSTIKAREMYSKLDIAKSCLTDQDTLYFVSQGNNGEDLFTARYYLTPIYLPYNILPTLGDKYGESDIWTQNLTVEEFSKVIVDLGITHIYLFHVDKNFNNHYGSMFEELPVDNSLFEVYSYDFDKIGFKRICYSGN